MKTILILFFAASVLSAEAQVTRYSVGKHERFTQTDTTAPTLDPTIPWHLTAAVKVTSPGDLSSAPILTAPTGGSGTNPLTLAYSSGNGAYGGDPIIFSTRQSLDAAYPDGTYRMRMVSPLPSFGTKNVNLSLNPAVYSFPKDIPKLSNTSWSGGALILDAAVTNTLSWNSFTQKAGNDNINFNLSGPGVNVAVKGAITSYVLNANVLVAGAAYSGSIEFAHITTNDTTSVSGATGGAGYVVKTTFTIRTLPLQSTNDSFFVAAPASNIVERFSSTGVDRGPFATTGLVQPTGGTFDRNGNLYVSNRGNNTVRKFSPTGVDLGVFAGTANQPPLDQPVGLAFDSLGNLYVGNNHGNTIWKFSATGVDLGKWASTGLNAPNGMAFDSQGNLYVANDTDFVEKFSPTGADLGPFATGLNSPKDVAFDAAGNVYVVIGDGNTVQKFDPARNNLGVFVSGLNQPKSLAFDSLGNLYVTNAGDNTILRFSSAGMPLGLFASTGSNVPYGIRIRRSVNGDFNSDGKADLAWQNTVSGDRVLWFMNAGAVTGQASLGQVAPAWSIAGTGDFNGDGKPDLVWQNTATGDRVVWFMNGATLIGQASLGQVAPVWQIAGIGDFNGDGKPDIAWQNTVTGDRVVWFMNGTTIVGQASLGLVAPVWQIAGIGDFNGDGKPDIVWQNTATGDRVVWFMDGTNIAGQAYLGLVAPTWQIAAIGDFNGDGKPDIAWQNAVTGDRVLWFMTGTSVAGQASLGVVAPAWQIR